MEEILTKSFSGNSSFETLGISENIEPVYRSNTSSSTREDHLQWCRDRAMNILAGGDVTGALASMLSDIKKHEETKNHPTIQLGIMLMMTGNLSSKKQAKDLIEGFN